MMRIHLLSVLRSYLIPTSFLHRMLGSHKILIVEAVPSYSNGCPSLLVTYYPILTSDCHYIEIPSRKER